MHHAFVFNNVFLSINFIHCHGVKFFFFRFTDKYDEFTTEMEVPVPIPQDNTQQQSGNSLIPVGLLSPVCSALNW